MADEVDKDLNMIQPAKTGSEIALEQLLENSEDVAVLTPQITTQKGLDKYKEGVQADAQFLESFQTGEVDKDLDANRSMFEDVTSVRARNQGEGIKGLKAIGGGLYMGALIAMEQAGYVADIDTYANFFRDIEDVSGNAWTRLMKDMQEKGRESGIFKIWEQTPDENSLASQVFKWTSLEGAISSAVGFGVTGLGAARLVSYLGSMKKFATLGKLTDAVMGNVAGKSMAGATKQFVGPLAASGMSNFFMGQLMAADTFNQTMAEFKPRIDSGELGEYEVQKIASNNAQEVVGLNMALSLTAYLKFGSIFKRRQQLKSLVANPTALHQMKGLIARGSPTAFTENVYQEMIQMEQLHDVKGAFGIEDEYAENYWDRMSNLALSNRALHAGALGIAGGPIQFAIIQRPMMGRQLAEQRNIYNKQQESLDWHKQVVANGFAKFQDYERIIGEAILEGNAADAEFVGDLQVLDGLADSVEWGTLDYLRKDIETILAYDQAEAIEKGYTQADYKETAQKFLDTISSAEQITLAHAGVINRGEVAFNRLAAIRTAEALVKLEVDAKIAHTAVQERARLHLNLDADVRFDEKFNIARDPNRHVNLTEQQKARAVNKEKAQDESLNAFLANSADYGAYLDSFKDFNKYIKLAESLDKRYKQITSDKYQKDLAKRENERGADLKRAITADKQAKEEDIVQEEFSRFKPFARVVAEVPTEEVQKTLKTDFTGEVKGRTPKRDATFSAIDENGVLRNYTKGDKVRSVDGRIFKVDSQNRGTKGESQAHMPILYEVGTDGKAIIPLNEAGEKVPFDEVKFVLGDNTFLRTEVLQKYKNGQYAEYWAPYVNPDSLLKPNDPLYQHGRLRMLSKARAKSLNISARAIREAEFGWTERYAMEQLDIPFQAPYEIYLDVKKVGERETHVDVYKKTPAGQSDVLLTRLDRDYNLNYEAIINAAAKGRVTGKVVEHFSSGKNIVRRYDEDGNRLFSSINEMHKMDSEYLPNGRVILAQVKRGDAPIEVAADTEGTVYNKGFIEVTRNGIKESLDIPYHAMTPGDTYVLIVTPSGRLAPIATTTKSIQDMPSTMGDNFTSDVSALISESINSVYKEEIENQVESDKTIRTAVENSERYKPGQVNREIARRKNEMLRKKYADLKESLENTAFTHIREFKRFYNFIGRQEADGNVTTIIEKNVKGVPTINAGLFNVVARASEKTGNIVPAIEVRNPRNHAVWHKTKNPGGGTIFYNIADNPAEFYQHLGRRRKRMSINDLGNPEIEGSRDNKVNQLVKSGEVTTDINIAQPFAGSSATIEMDGTDLRDHGFNILAQKEKAYKKRFGKKLQDELDFIMEDNSERATEDFNASIDEFLSVDEDAFTISNIAEADNSQDIVDYFKDKVGTFSIHQESEALKLMTELFDGELTEVDELRIADIVTGLEDRGITDNLKTLARGVLGIERIQEQVGNEEFTIRQKAGRGVNPTQTARMTQPEGYTFTKGSHVFSETHKEGYIQKVRPDGLYVVNFGKRAKPVTVVPADIYAFFGNYKKMIDTRSRLAKLEKDDTKYDTTERELLRIENQIERARQYRDGTLTKDKEVPHVPIINLDVATFSDFLYLTEKRKRFLEGINKSERYKQIAGAFSHMAEIAQSIDKSNANKDLTTEHVGQVLLAARNAIFYTDLELDALEKLALEKNDKDKAVAFTNLKSIKTQIEHLVADEGNEYLNPISATVQTFSERTDSFRSIDFNILSVRAAGKSGVMEMNLMDDVLTFINDMGTKILIASQAESALQADLYSQEGTKAPSPAPTIVEDIHVIADRVEDLKEEEPLPPDSKPDSADRTAKLAELNETDLSNEELALLASLDVAKLNEFHAEYMAYYTQGLDTKGILESYVTPPFKRGEAVTSTPEEFAYEVAEVKKMIPQVPVEVLEKVGNIHKKFGAKGIGAYHNGVRYLVQNAAKGTAYHETFHAVADLYLTPQEKKAIAEQRGGDIWSIELEESLAEDFEGFVKKRKSFTGRIRAFFQGLLDWFMGARSSDVTTRVFEKIMEGGYAESESVHKLNNIDIGFNTLEEFTASLSKDNTVLLQNLMEQKRIKIVC